MKNILFTFSALAILAFGCSKEGLDGDATLVIKPAHHGLAIASTVAYQDSVFIKFNVKDAPADPTHDYDALVVGTVGEDHIHIENVKWGDYFIYCTGWDTTINQRVEGGVAVKIKRSDRKDEIVVDVPVVE